MVQHISFSGFKIWDECPHRFKIEYIDGKKGFTGNIFTAFGTAIHEVCEKTLLNEWKTGEEAQNFSQSFQKEWESLDEDLKVEKDLDVFMEQGKKLAPICIPELKKVFEGCEVVQTEMDLYENIEGSNLKFKGFVDLILKNPKTGKYYIIDWKTCSWGWDARRKSDKITGYQLVFYKKFIAEKLQIDPKMIECFFALLKRTAKKDQVEFVRITTGNRKMKNAEEALNKAVHFIDKGFYPKKKTSCSKCPFKRTEWCP